MIRIWILVTVVVCLSGCGLRHDGVRIELPAVHINPRDGAPVVVDRVRDIRNFSDTLDLVQKIDISERKRLVGGAYRGGNGIAVDLVDETVETQTRKIIVQALRELGYKVIPLESATSDVPRVDVDIEKFFVALPFDFWRAASYSQHMLADMSTNVTVSKSGGDRTFVAKGHGENIYQVTSAENWQIALNKAVVEYSKQFQEKMADSAD